MVNGKVKGLNLQLGEGLSQGQGPTVRGSDCGHLRAQSVTMKMEKQRHYRSRKVRAQLLPGRGRRSNLQLDSTGVWGTLLMLRGNPGGGETGF